MPKLGGMNSSTIVTKPRLSTVALPAEHGSWAFLYEPLLCGLWLAPSWAGLWFAVATCALFLLRHPLKLLWLGWQRGVQTPKQRLAQQVVGGYAVAAVLALLAAGFTASSYQFMGLALVLLPLAGFVIAADLGWGSRHLLTELLAPTVLAGPAGCLVLLGGGDYPAALGVWLLLCGRAIPAVLLVRVLVQERKQNFLPAWPPLVSHSFGLVVGLVGSALGWWSWWISGIYGVLLGRAVWLLSRWRPELTIKQLGFVEVGFGLLTVAWLVLALKI